MQQEIIEHLKGLNNNQRSNINDYLKSSFGNDKIQEIRTALLELIENDFIEGDRIEVKKLGNMVLLPEINQHKNTLADLDTVPILVRLKSVKYKGEPHPITVNSNNNININTGGGNIQQVNTNSTGQFSSFNHLPPSTPNANMKSAIMSASKWVIKNIWSILISLIVAYIVYKLGWN